MKKTFYKQTTNPQNFNNTFRILLNLTDAIKRKNQIFGNKYIQIRKRMSYVEIFNGPTYTTTLASRFVRNTFYAILYLRQAASASDKCL